MKKLLGLLAFMLATVSFAQGEQDVVKNFWINNDWRFRYTDKSGNDANRLGNEGFKKDNKDRYRVRTEVGGTMGLNDEYGLDANFYYRHDGNKFYSNGKANGSKSSTDLIDANLAKSLKLGSLDTTTKLGVRHWTNKSNGGFGHNHYTGQSNEFYFGPTFNLNLLGQNFETTAQAVYFTQNGTGDQDGRYYKTGSNGAKEGWGANLVLGTDGKIYEGSFGTISYDVSLANFLRDARGRDNKSTVYLDYYTALSYDTPSFGGFYAFVKPENEWYKHTAKSGYENEFTVWTGIGYKTGFDTSIGVININPSIRYSPVNKLTDKGEYFNGSDKKTTIERNELRAGIKVSLDVK